MSALNQPPNKMRALSNWVSWKLETRDGKTTKPLYIVGTNKHAKANDPSTWTTYEAATASVAVNGKQGIGFAFGDSGIVGIDIDGCRNPETAQLAPWADTFLESLPPNTYVEITPSGYGVRALVSGKLPEGERVFHFDKSIGFGDKVQVELLGPGRYATVSLNPLYEEIGDIEPCNLVFVRSALLALKKAHPATRETKKEETNSSIAASSDEIQRTVGAPITTKYNLLKNGTLTGDKPCTISDGLGNSKSYADRSAADQAFCNVAAIEHKGDADLIWADYQASAVFQPKWGKREQSFRDLTVKKALEFYSKIKPVTAVASVASQEIGYGALNFKYPAVQGTPFDFVLGPAMGSSDGWFPRGDPSLVGGPSGSSKTTLLVDLLEAQKKCETFLGHETFGLPYIIVMADRGENAHKRTAKRMRYDPDVIPIEYIPTVWGAAALQAILQKIENATPFPAVVFVEGCDTLVENASKMEVVAPFVEGLQKIASHYHIALIGSVGAPKERVGEGYVATRDNIIGSVVWSRKSETIACLKYVKGDDTDRRRKLVVLPRNAAAEKFPLILEDGRLVVDHSGGEDSKPKVGGDVEWYRTQGDWFTPEDVLTAWKISRAQAYRCVTEAFTKHVLKTKQKVVGEARQYRWNDKETNPYNSRNGVEEENADAHK